MTGRNLQSDGKRKGLFPSSYAAWRPLDAGMTGDGKDGGEHARRGLEAMRIHGGYGYSQEFVVERIYRDAPVLILGEGSNEIQQLVIARRLLERYPL